MKPSLQLRLGQNLTLTPQLRQAIRLLQLSSMELEQEISLALESNPLLERPEDATPDPDTGHPEGDGPGENQHEHADGIEPITGDEPLDIPDWAQERHADDYAAGPATSSDEEREAGFADDGESLHDHLVWQLNLTPMSPRDRNIALTLIDAIGDDGYLTEPLDALREGLLPELDVELAEIEAVLHRIQRFDPLGVGARSLSECLLVQLSQGDDDAPVIRRARRIASDHLEALAKLGIERLAATIGESVQDVRESVDLLRSLDPRPGAGFFSTQPEFITPDAYAIRNAGGWQVRLGSVCQPRLAINRHYESLIGVANKNDSSYLRGQLQEARWLIKSLETRADTVLRVAQCIVHHQSDFLEYGPEAMRPLVLREVAEELELHESTISRVTTRKYLHTPRGTFEFKYFFSSSLGTTDGGSASGTAIQAMIRRMVEQENPRKPLSDARLVQALAEEGVTVARRTVAKYRELMAIPSSNERQRL